jgi:hypothetical protein
MEKTLSLQQFHFLLEPISKKHLTLDGAILNQYKVFTITNELKLKMI